MASSWTVVLDPVGCPRCGAPAGQPCRRRDGGPASVPHVSRCAAARQPHRAAVPAELPWFDFGHPPRSDCPACHRSCSRIALIDIVYAFERCDCRRQTYVHLVEQLYHRACLTGAGQPAAAPAVERTPVPP